MRKDLIIGIQARSASEWVNAAAKDSLAGAPCSYSMSLPSPNISSVSLRGGLSPFVARHVRFTTAVVFFTR
jgi:hypothetical protein